MTKQQWMFLAAAFTSVPLAAQAPQRPAAAPQTINEAVSKAMGVAFIAPKCSVKNGHFMVNSSATYYKQSFEMKDPEMKAGMMKKAKDTGLQAITENKQDQNGAAWYWLGRSYFHTGDLRGADTAMRHAEKLLPDCVEEIKSYRRAAYGAIMQPAVELYRMNKADSAIILFRLASMMDADAPDPYFSLAVAYNESNPDSAIKYFKLTQAKATDSKYKTSLASATGQLVALYQNKGDEASAVAEARKLVQMTGDIDAKRLLYSVLVRSKDAALQNEAKGLAGELTAAAEADGSISANELARNGIMAYESEEFEKARSYFDKALAKEPWRRDIAMNSIKVSYQVKDYERMLKGLEAQMAAEPLSDDYLTLQIKALQGLQPVDTARLNRAAIVWSALPVGIFAMPLVQEEKGVRLVAEASGREATDEKGRVIPPHPVTIVIEFLDSKGAVVVTEEVKLGALTDGSKQGFQVEAIGKGIVDFRYREKKS